MSAASWVLIVIAVAIIVVSLLGLWEIAKQIKQSNERAEHLQRVADEIWGKQ